MAKVWHVGLGRQRSVLSRKVLGSRPICEFREPKSWLTFQFFAIQLFVLSFTWDLRFSYGDFENMFRYAIHLQGRSIVLAEMLITVWFKNSNSTGHVILWFLKQFCDCILCNLCPLHFLCGLEVRNCGWGGVMPSWRCCIANYHHCPFVSKIIDLWSLLCITEKPWLFYVEPDKRRWLGFS